MEMKLWRISQTVTRGYDTFSDAVVAAKNETEARNIHPYGYLWCGETVETDAGWYTQHTNGPNKGKWVCIQNELDEYSSWAHPQQVKVELIGTAIKGTKKGIICSSYHAG